MYIGVVILRSTRGRAWLQNQRDQAQQHIWQESWDGNEDGGATSSITITILGPCCSLLHGPGAHRRRQSAGKLRKGLYVVTERAGERASTEPAAGDDQGLPLKVRPACSGGRPIRRLELVYGSGSEGYARVEGMEF